MKVESYDSDQRFSFHRLADTCHSPNPKARTKFNSHDVFLHQLFCRSYGFIIILYSNHSQLDRGGINECLARLVIVPRRNVDKCRFCFPEMVSGNISP